MILLSRVFEGSAELWWILDVDIINTLGDMSIALDGVNKAVRRTFLVGGKTPFEDSLYRKAYTFGIFGGAATPLAPPPLCTAMGINTLKEKHQYCKLNGYH